MARPKKNNVEYFPHTVIHGKKMSYIEKKYKNDGYAVWFKILEELGSTDNHYLNLNDDVQIMFLSDKCLVTEDLLISIINDLVRLKEFDAELWNDNKIIYCQKFTDSIQDAYNKRTNDCINKESLTQLLISLCILKPINPTRKPRLKESEVVEKPQSKVKETKEDNIITTTPAKAEVKIDFNKLLLFINETTGRKFKTINKNIQGKYLARLKDGYTNKDIQTAILNSVKATNHIETKNKYLTPEFYSRAEKLDMYSDVSKKESSLLMSERVAHIKNNVKNSL